LEQRRGLHLNLVGGFDHLQNGLPEFLKRREVPLAYLVPMVLVDAEQFDAKQDRIILT
jgi:hypothetical protein